MSRIIFLPVMILALVYAAVPVRGEDSAEAGPDSSASYRWGGVYTSRIELDEYSGGFPWNDPISMSHLTDRVSLMFDAQFVQNFHFFIKGTTGLWNRDEEIYSSRFFIDQGHLSATWQGRVTGKLFLRERVLRNRNSLMFLVSNDSKLTRWRRGEGLDVVVLTPGPVLLTYTSAVFRDHREQKQNFGLPTLPIKGGFLNLLEGGIRRSSWHVGMALANVTSTWYWEDYLALYGFDGGFRLMGGRVNLEFARTAREWEDFEDGLLGLDLDAMTWGNFSAGLPDDGVFAAEWTGFAWNGGDNGKFGLTPGYRYSGYRFRDHIGEVPSGYVESYVEAWWKHARLASLVSLKAADRYSYRTQKGGGVLETSLWTRFTGGLETTVRAFFAEGSRPVFIVSTVDDNSLTRLLMTARIDDTGGKSEFSFLTEAGINLGRRWTLGGSVYLERSVTGFYSADIEARAGKRFVFRASMGTYLPVSTYADLNYDPSPARTRRDKTISFYTRIWLGGI
jgi:hypothetical protein